MSTTNNQSIQQINTAALRGTREAHQPDEIKPTAKEISMNTVTARPRRKKRQKTVQPVHDLEAAARYLASYIRAHAVPLNKMEGK